MQWSEMVAGAGLLVFFLIMGLIAGVVTWRIRRMQHEERRLMIEKGMAPPNPMFTSWPQVKQRENELRFEERRLMIEKGMVPPETPVSQDRWRRDDFLRNGVMSLFLGVGLVITHFLLADTAPSRTWLAYLGPALAMFGLACLTYAALTARDDESRLSESRRAAPAAPPGSSRPADQP